MFTESTNVYLPLMLISVGFKTTDKIEGVKIKHLSGQMSLS